MIEEYWKRIAGMHVTATGDIALAWIARDPDTDVIHCYDYALFRNEPPAVIAEGIGARGRWIPVAWEAKAKPTADMLLDRGIKMLVEPLREDDALAEVISHDVWERMLTHRFKVAKSMSGWADEYKTYFRTDAAVPKDSHPLMAATRLAVAQIKQGKILRRKNARTRNYPHVAIV